MEMALRGLFDGAKSVRPVVVSTLPAAFIRPTVRGTTVAAVPESAGTPVLLAYPVRNMLPPFFVRVSSPSEVEVPLAMSCLFAPLAVSGSAMD